MAAYLRFMIGKQGYAIAVQHVIEVLHLVEVTPVPEQPDDHLGVITLRGQVIPVVDLRLRFGGSSSELTLTTPMIALQIEGKPIAVVVDSVDDVVDLNGTFEPYPEPGIESITRIDEAVVMVPSLEYLMRYQVH